jgi:hypothetical protein
MKATHLIQAYSKRTMPSPTLTPHESLHAPLSGCTIADMMLDTPGSGPLISSPKDNLNGIAVSSWCEKDDAKVFTVYSATSTKDQYGDRAIYAFHTFEGTEGILRDERMLNHPISYFYDGIRVSRYGYIFAGAGDGVDIIDSRWRAHVRNYPGR